MIIYDFGANVGQNTDYFVSKKHKVVAIDANPVLCGLINEKYAKEISEGKLVVINCCLSETSDDEKVKFYVHKKISEHSQFLKPEEERIHEFEEIEVFTRKPSSIVKQYGEPYYIKIDIEHYDKYVLRDLINNGIVSKYISVEAHNPEVLTMLINSKKYKRFNAVSGDNLHRIYSNFVDGSSGPFGSDIKSPWLNEKGIKKLFTEIPFGWIDIHASTDQNIPVGKLDLKFYPFRVDKIADIKIIIKRIIPSSAYKFLNKLNRIRLGLK